MDANGANTLKLQHLGTCAHQTNLKEKIKENYLTTAKYPVYYVSGLDVLKTNARRDVPYFNIPFVACYFRAICSGAENGLRLHDQCSLCLATSAVLFFIP
jgi:hypothetical protein